MTASGDTLTPTVGWANAPSAYAGQMPKLREFAQLSAADPRRGRLREELILAFRPVVEHLARRYANPVSGAAEELTQVGTVALIAAIDRWDAAVDSRPHMGNACSATAEGSQRGPRACERSVVA
jgi:hypothetical protein